MLLCTIYHVYPLPPPSSLRIPSHCDQLDTYYCTYTMPGSVSAFTWSMVASRSHRKRCQTKDVKSIHKVHIWWVCPSTLRSASKVPAHGYQLDTYHWTYIMPGSAIFCTWAITPSSGQLIQGNTNSCEMVILLEHEFWGIEKELIPNMWQLVFTNVLVKGWIIHSYENSLFYSSNEVMLETWWKLVFKTTKLCSWRTFENLVQPFNTTKQNEKPKFYMILVIYLW